MTNLGALDCIVNRLAHELQMPRLSFPKRLDTEHGPMATHSPVDEPHATMPDFMGDARVRLQWNCYRGHLDPDDMARLQEEPATLRHRWVEAWESAEPLLETLASIYLSKTHLSEPVDMVGLDKYPYALGRSWVALFGSANAVFGGIVAWTRDWSCVRRSWAAGRYEQLQPACPAPWHPMMMLSTIMSSTCGIKEQELQGSTGVKSFSRPRVYFISASPCKTSNGHENHSATVGYVPGASSVSASLGAAAGLKMAMASTSQADT